MSSDRRTLVAGVVAGLVAVYGLVLCVALGIKTGLLLWIGSLFGVALVTALVLVVAGLAASAAAVAVAVLPVAKVPLSYNRRNLTVRWKTTLVTALAFTLVIALLTVMLAFVNGMNRLTESSGIPGNVLILADGATDEAFSNLPPGASVLTLPDDLQRRIETIDRDGKKYPLATKEVF